MREADRHLRVTRRERERDFVGYGCCVCTCIGNNLKEKERGENALISPYGGGVEFLALGTRATCFIFQFYFLLAGCEACKGRMKYHLGISSAKHTEHPTICGLRSKDIKLYPLKRSLKVSSAGLRQHLNNVIKGPSSIFFFFLWHPKYFHY